MTKAKIIHERQKHCWMLAYSLIVLGQFTLVQQQQKKSHIQCWELNIHPLNIWKYKKSSPKLALHLSGSKKWSLSVPPEDNVSNVFIYQQNH